MKTKLLGLAASLVLVLGIAYSGYDFYTIQQRPGGLFAKNYFTGKSKSVSKRDKYGIVPKPDKTLDDLRQRNEPKLKQLRTPQGRESGRVNMIMLGFSQDSIRMSQDSMKALTEDFRKRIISMTFITGDERFAVIDGQLYKEGDEIANGAKIRTVRADKVLIAGREILQWVEVHNPIEIKKKVRQQQEIIPSVPDPAKAEAAAPAAPAASGAAASSGNILESLKMIQNYKGMLNNM
ncbi:hypothetical protein [Magnetococcus sp. PR-3]|uniref:hypothetical protein n=1 Tax=Magnetococcus sp. PR-3 TaxID=3120355 RepID=UPI002FCE264A